MLAITAATMATSSELPSWVDAYIVIVGIMFVACIVSVLRRR
jgi:hypothetical protein